MDKVVHGRLDQAIRCFKNCNISVQGKHLFLKQSGVDRSWIKKIILTDKYINGDY